jgi:hypothetical protein
MGELIKYNQLFASNLTFSLSWGAIIQGLLIVALAIGILWEWKQDVPKGEKFWFCCGIFFHWVATVNGRGLFLLSDSQAILKRTEHFLTSFNIILVIVAGVFYFRALSNHWKPNLWKYVVGGIVGFIMLMYLYRVIL